MIFVFSACRFIAGPVRRCARALGLLLLAAMPASADNQPPLYRDTTSYPPLNLTWNISTDEQQVTGVFPHSVVIGRAVLATAAGLLLTNDSGHTWTALPQATADLVGPILDVAFHPVLPDTFYIASQTKGIWATTDDGQTFTQIGTKAKGLASDTVVALNIYSGDLSHQTLLAVHGDAAAGLSRTIDQGNTWDVVNTDYHFRRLLSGEGDQQGAGDSRQLYLFGSSLKEPDIQSIYSCSTVGEFVTEAVRDVVPTDMVYALTPYRKPAAVYLTTSDSGLYLIDNGNSAGLSYNVKQVPFAKATGWASVATSWGPSADVVNLFLYDPTNLGLVVSHDDLVTSQTASDGLPTSSMVKEGAVLRPNANGTVFYAVANDALAIGREPDDVPVVDFSPAAFEVNPDDDSVWGNLSQEFQKFSNFNGHTTDAAKALLQSVSDPAQLYLQHRMVITARVPIVPAPPKSVTVDLSRYGGYPDTALFDDGQHHDGVAGDGVYGSAFDFLPGKYPPQDGEWRTYWPGRVAMGVTATYADGHRQGAVGVANVFPQMLNIGMYHDGIGSVAADVEGGVTIEPFLNPLDPKQPAYAPRLHKGDVAIRIKAPKGSWKVHFKAPYNHHNIDSHPAISFYIRLDAGVAPKDMSLQLRDVPDFSPPLTTAPVPLLQGLTLNNHYQRVVVPMTKIIGTDSQFQSDHLDEIILSGDSDAPATLVVDGMQALATYPPADTTDAAP